MQCMGHHCTERIWLAEGGLGWAANTGSLTSVACHVLVQMHALIGAKLWQDSYIVLVMVTFSYLMHNTEVSGILHRVVQ